MNKLFSIFIVISVSIFCSCGNDDHDIALDNKDNPRISMCLTPTEQVISNAYSEFAFKLSKAINESSNYGDSFVFSPLCTSFSLTMLANGTSNETLKNSMKEMGLPDISIEELNKMNMKLSDSLNILDKRCVVEFANSVWVSSVLSPADSYVNCIEEFYKGELYKKDFSSNGIVNDVNNWCSKATKGKIKNLLSGIPANTTLLLANAVYFKAPWQKPFKKAEDGIFTSSNGDEQRVKYMTSSLNTACYDNGKCVVASLPYGNRAFSFRILLPNKGVSIDECIEDLANDYWIDNEDFLRFADLSIKMPKFNIESKSSLLSSIKEAGVNACFAPGADYTNLFADTPFSVAEFLQATTFTVDEEGTEAAASIVNTGFTSPGYESMELVVDRPFLFFVQEQSTGAILFIGKVGKI